MHAKKIHGTVVEKKWLTKSVMLVSFQTPSKLEYVSGQFLSVVIPPSSLSEKSVKRAYSFASACSSIEPGEPGKPGLTRRSLSHELCVKYVEGGVGSEFLASLQKGDEFTAFAPYGDFIYRQNEGRKVCFISTGSGIGPFRSMILSYEFQTSPPEETLMLFGARTEEEIIFPEFFEKLGVKTVVALTQPSPTWTGFHGRVTDFLKSLPSHWDWHNNDYYICGNSNMVIDVVKILRNGHGVSQDLIHQEVFFKSKTELQNLAVSA